MKFKLLANIFSWQIRPRGLSHIILINPSTRTTKNYVFEKCRTKILWTKEIQLSMNRFKKKCFTFTVIFELAVDGKKRLFYSDSKIQRRPFGTWHSSGKNHLDIIKFVKKIVLNY